jgi:putative transposase
MDIHDARKLRAMEEENARMKRIIANQAMQIDVLKEIKAKKW